MMKRYYPLGIALWKVDPLTRRRIVVGVQPVSALRLHSGLVVVTGWLLLSAGCSSVQSFVASTVTAEAPADPTYAGRQHFPVSPGDAVECLGEVARHQGWKVVSTGEEHGTQGERGKFFRLETTARGEGKQTVTGIIYAEPSGSYVRISEQNGLPAALVEPLIAAIKEKMGDR